MGRPSAYSVALAARLCARISAGMSLRSVCRAKDMPSKSMVFRWIGERAAFREQYSKALEARGCAYGERVAEVVEMTIVGELAPDRARVAIDGLKWAAGRMAPKVYGERLALTGADGGPIETRATISHATRARAVLALVTKAETEAA